MSSITINSNVSALNAQRLLGKSTTGLRDAFSRLSSGLRINKASDDAAGLAIASSLNADRRVFDQGVRNLNDGLSLLSIADGALSELTNITVRLSELAEQAANGSMTVSQRGALDDEAQALKSEFKRIAQTTQFNGLSLFSAAFGNMRLQTGFGEDASIQSSLGGAAGTGQFLNNSNFTNGSNSLADVRSADMNNDGFMDLVGIGSNGGSGFFVVAHGDGQGSFTPARSTLFQGSVLTPNAMEIGDINGDSILDVVRFSSSATVRAFIGNASGTYTSVNIASFASLANTGGMTLGDVNNDGILDIAAAGQFSGGSDDAINYIMLGNGNGTFLAPRSVSTSIIGTDRGLTVQLADLNRDGSLDMVTEISVDGANGGYAAINLGDGRGGFGVAQHYSGQGFTGNDLALGDLNNDGILDLAMSGLDSGTADVVTYLGRGDGTFANMRQISMNGASQVHLADLNGDGNNDLISNNVIRLGNGNGTFAAVSTITLNAGTTNLITGDVNSDGVLDILGSSSTNARLSAYIQRTTSGLTPILDFSLNTQADARQAIPLFRQKLDQLGKQRGAVGAFQARIESAVSNTLSMSLNVASAASQITNADVAEESAQLVKQQILQQVGTSILAQANQTPALALRLLQI